MNHAREASPIRAGACVLLATLALIAGCSTMSVGTGGSASYGYGPGYASPWGTHDPFYMNPVYLGPPMTVPPLPAPPPGKPTTLPGRVPPIHPMPPGRRR